ncbi:NADPH-dependent FMN reductase [Actinoalloteichus sp. AHMU CJ021]|uniref:FMN reductase n=1 Tax=Actinoalloteichus TaxID=65496 RepID=UPI0004AB7C08|nr:FMN reductase [Actinoalloteichus caeruleus]AUS80175.1 NADPH-dependent FMN reductase [Actinoalloteichus sp. AHMU CJ021]
MTTRTITVISAGIGQPSSTRLLADRLAEATTARLTDRGLQVDLEVVELRDHARSLANTLLTGFATGPLGEVVERVGASDGLVAVTPVFSASYSGLFKMFFDVLDPDLLVGTPVLAGATGGTARHSLALEHAVRPLFSYLRSVVVPTAVYAAPEDWAGGGADTALAERIGRAAEELATLVAAREPGSTDRRDGFEQPTPFEDLLFGDQR